MKYRVTGFKSLKLALPELAQFILWVGKPVVQFGHLRPRELVGNWLVCAVLSHASGRAPWTFATDHAEGDGGWWTKFWSYLPTEHVLFLKGPTNDVA